MMAEFLGHEEALFHRLTGGVRLGDGDAAFRRDAETGGGVAEFAGALSAGVGGVGLRLPGHGNVPSGLGSRSGDPDSSGGRCLAGRALGGAGGVGPSLSGRSVGVEEPVRIFPSGALRASGALAGGGTRDGEGLGTPTAGFPLSSGLGERPARAAAPLRPPFSSSPLCLLFLLLFLPLLLLLSPLSSQASAAPLEKVVLQLKWIHAFQFAGYYAALEQGFYREAGLDVEIREARPGMDSVAEVTEGRASFGVGASGILLARAAGRPVVALAAVFQHSPLVLIARKDAVVRGVMDLVGKRIMLEPGSEELLAFLRREGLPPDAVTRTEHSFDYRDLLEGRAEAISAYSTYEPYFLDREHVPFVLYTPLDAGIDFYGDVLFTSEAELAAHPDRVRAFREASLRGWRHAMANPEEAARLVSTRYTSPDMLEFHHFEWRQMVPLLRIDAVPLGEMTVPRWQHIAEVYADLDMLSRNFSLEGFLYGPGVSAAVP